jgi:dTDP-4-amino-4,6-dideoxygalactose transaminase
MTKKPAIIGGKPVRKEVLPFYRPFIGKKEIKSIEKVLRSGWITSGEITRNFEDNFRRYIGSKFAIAVSSCTAGLHLSLVSLGIEEDDEIITTPLTFAATANVIVHQKARPVFVDIDKETLNINPDYIAERISSKTKAILAVHMAGLPCRINQILEIANKKKIPVIEDAAHALGSRYLGRQIGTWSKATVFSFHAVKNITTAEGGMVTTNDKRLAKKIRILSFHGLDKDAWLREDSSKPWCYRILDAGYKCNLTDMQSALGIEQLKRLKYFLKLRNKYAQFYNEAFKDIPQISIPTQPEATKHSWHLYIIRLNVERLKINRDQFIQALRKENICASVHFIPLHLHPFYQKQFGYKKGDFSNAEDIYKRIVSLPLYPKMTIADLQDVIKAVKRIVDYYRR